MFGANRTSDKELSKTVNKRLVRAGGGSQTHLAAAVQQGTVTLTGLIRYEAQRRPILKAMSSIAGVSRVIDRLQLMPKTNHG
jgi:osmotically-inducible protein OsmY